MITIKRTNSEDEQFQEMVYLLDLDLHARYPTEQQEFVKFNKITGIDTAVLALVDGEPVGCGCLRPYDSQTIELKRMYVKPAHRGKGIAPAILRELELWAAGLGFQTIILETGRVGQPEAVGLYTKFGYKEIPNYPPYEHMPQSICMQKTLAVSQ